MSLASNGGHLTVSDLKLLKQDKLQLKDKFEALEHIGNCDECAIAFSGLFQEAGLIEEPAEFIPAAVKRLNDIVVQKKAVPDNRSFWGYTFRVGLAACLTLTLLFSGVFNYTANLKNNIPTLDLKTINTFTKDVRHFSDKIMKMEVIKYDKKEK